MTYELVNIYIHMMIVRWLEVHCCHQQLTHVQKGGKKPDFREWQAKLSFQDLCFRKAVLYEAKF